MDEERNRFDRARRLLSRVMARLVQQAFLRWKMYCRLERTIKELAAVVDPVADVLEKLPENRTPADVQRLMPLVSQIEAYRQLHPPVRELLASYLQLVVLTDRTELPRGPADHTCLFSVVYGSMTALLGDPADPALASIRSFAAEQLQDQPSPEGSSQRLIGFAVSSPGQVLRSDSTISLGGGGSGQGNSAAASPEHPGTPKAAIGGGGGFGGEVSFGRETSQRLQSQQSRRLGPTGPVVKVAEGGSGGLTTVGSGAAAASAAAAAGQQQQERVSPRLWRTVIEIINKLNKLQKAQAVRELAAQHAAALEDMALSVAGRAAAAAGGKAAAAALAAAGGSPGGGARAGATAIGMGVLPAATAEGGYMRLLPALAALRTQVLVIRTGQSFSGRELSCQEEAGLMQDVGGHLDLPSRAVAAVVPKESLVAVVFVSREVYHRAMAMQSEISVRRAVDSCCRLPFLRHTPLKELYRLSRHLQEVAFRPGEVVLQQGRENGFIYFLVSGEVQVVLDLPDTSDTAALAAAMAALSGAKLSPQQAQALAAHAATTAPVATTLVGYGGGRGGRYSMVTATADGTVVPSSPGGGGSGGGGGGGGGAQQLPSFGATRRIVMGRRGSGVVLGDDLLREKRLTVGVVASSPCVCLAVSPQRFTMCCDPLTLRLFHKLRIQHSATALFTDSLLHTEERAALGAMFREAILCQSYGPSALKREEGPGPKAWRAPSVRPEEIGIPADKIYQPTITTNNAAAVANGTAAAASGGAASASSASASALTLTPRGGCRVSSGGGGAAATTSGPAPASLKAQGSHAASAAAAGSTTAAAASAAPTAADGVPQRLYGGLTVTLVQELVGRGAESGSMATFLQRIKASEADALALPGGSGGRDGQLGPRDLDLSQQMGGITAQPQKMYTDMHEAACMAVIKVELVPGQLDVRLDPLAQVLDDIVVQWNDLSHRWGLQLVRWRTHDYFLVTPLDTASSRGGKRSRVRVMADALLSMAGEFRRIVAQNEIPHLTMCAGLAIGGLFSSYDSGHFLVHCTGQAYSAAKHLCKMACEESQWQGSLLVADSVAQALSRTHVVTFAAGGNVLVGAVGCPPGCPRSRALPTHQPTGRALPAAASVDAEEDDEPVSQGTRPYFKRGGDGGGGSRRLLLTSSSPGSRRVFKDNPEASYLNDDGDPYGGGESYTSVSVSIGSGVVQHVLPSNHHGLPRLVSVTAPLPRLPTQQNHGHGHGQNLHHHHYHHHQLLSQPMGPQQQPQQPPPQQQQLQLLLQSNRRNLSVAVSGPLTAAIPLSSVYEASSGGGGVAGSKGWKAGVGGSPPTGTHHSTTRLAPLTPADGGAEPYGEASCRSDDQHNRRQPLTRHSSDLPGSFPNKQSVMLGGGGGSGGPGLMAAASTAMVASIAASTTSSPRRADMLYGDGNSYGSLRASMYGSQRSTAGTALRLTANARHRERIAASNTMSYRQQLLQEISQLRQQQQHELLLQQQHQQQQQQFGKGRGRRQQPSPGLWESGYQSDIDVGGGGRGGGGGGSSKASYWRGANAAAAASHPNGTGNGSGNGRGASPPPSSNKCGATGLADVPPSPAPSGRSEAGGDASPPSIELRPLGPSHGYSPDVLKLHPASRSPSPEGLGSGGAALQGKADEGTKLPLQPQPQPHQSLHLHPDPNTNLELTASPCRSPSFSPRPDFSPSLNASPILGLQASKPLSPDQIHVASPETQRVPSPGYLTAAVRAAAEGEEAYGCSGDSKDRNSPSGQQLAVGPLEHGAAAEAAAAVVAAGGAPLTALPARPIGVPSRRAPLGTQRPASPYIPFSAVEPTSDAAVVARGGSPPPHPGPPGTAGTVSSIPKLVACNYGYLQIPAYKSRARARQRSAPRGSSADGGAAAAAPKITVLRNIGGGGGGRYSRSQSANAFTETPVALLNLASRPGPMTPTSMSASASAGVSGGVSPVTMPSVSPDGGPASPDAGWNGRFRWPQSSGSGTSSPPKTPTRCGGGGPGTINAARVSRQCTPPSPAATMAAASVTAGGGGSGSGGRRPTSSPRRRGASWQDLGSQRAAEQYAASLPLGLMSVSFSTAGLSRVPSLQRLLYLESLALSYNHLVGLASEQITGISQNLKVLTLVSADLDQLPPDLGTLLPGLVELNLCSNRLSSLPPTLGAMTRLRSLSVAHNQLTSLPASLYTLATLEHLLLPYNRLTVIDEALGNLRQLQALDLGFNRLTELPNETTALGGCLTRLSMPYNQLHALPPGFLSAMMYLAVLVLDFNPQLAADPQLGGGRGGGGGSGGGILRSRAPSRLTLSSLASRGTTPPSASAGGGGAAGGGGGGSPGAEPSVATELSFGPPPLPSPPRPAVPDPTYAPGASSGAAAACATTLGPAEVSQSFQEGISVSSSGIVASTSALSHLLAASAAPSAAAAPLLSPLPPTPTSPASGGGPMAPQMLPALRVLSLSAVQLVQVPSWLPAGLQVLDLSRNNLRRLPSWLCRRLAPSLAVLRLHTNRLESLPSDLRTLSQLQLLSLEENPVASPERIATPQGAGWAAEWLYRKKYRSRPEIMASLVSEHTGLTGLTGPASGLNGGPSAGTLAPASAESSALTPAATVGGAGGGGGAAAASKAGSAAASSTASIQARSLRRGQTNSSSTAAAP